MIKQVINGKLLLKLARDAIFSTPDTSRLHSFMREKRGVFVTLKKNDSLRGCIGFPLPIKPLGEAVVQAARAAAFEDPRFPPLSKDEEVVIEVSVLSAPEKCSLKDIKNGDGVILKREFHRALFLPQVWEQIPDKHEFLSALAHKAGLTSYESCSFEKFSVQSFEE